MPALLFHASDPTTIAFMLEELKKRCNSACSTAEHGTPHMQRLAVLQRRSVPSVHLVHARIASARPRGGRNCKVPSHNSALCCRDKTGRWLQVACMGV